MIEPDVIMSMAERTYPQPAGMKSNADQQHFLVWIVYKDWTERTQRVSFGGEVNPAEAIDSMIERLMSARKP
jgi:hypothetical protein